MIEIYPLGLLLNPDYPNTVVLIWLFQPVDTLNVANRLGLAFRTRKFSSNRRIQQLSFLFLPWNATKGFYSVLNYGHSC